MVNFKPIRIPGRWKEGFALDYHTISSVWLGYDEYGHPVYDTKRTEVGELLYRLKYKSDRSVLEDIINKIELFFNSWKPPIDFIIPVPPSQSIRKQQPVKLITEELGRRLKIAVRSECIVRIKEVPAIKNVYEFDERVVF
jgi:predicted amidophosphoribosyltransferase